MSGTKIAFVDVDTQFDFMDPDGRLYVSGAEKRVPNLKRLIRHARERGIPIISTADAHLPDDPEFKDFPPHCVKGQPGQERIAATQTPGAVVIPSEGSDRSVAGCLQVIVEKRTIDVFKDSDLEKVVQQIAPEQTYVFGVATDYCILTAALGLRKRDYPVVVVTDAVQAIEQKAGEKALREMEARGVRFATTDEVLAET